MKKLVMVLIKVVVRINDRDDETNDSQTGIHNYDKRINGSEERDNGWY